MRHILARDLLLRAPCCPIRVNFGLGTMHLAPQSLRDADHSLRAPPQTTRPQTQTLATRTSPSLKCLRAGADTNLFFQMFYCETIFPAPGRNLPFKRNHQDHRGNVSVNIPAMCQSVLPPWLEKITKPNVFLPSACGLPRTNVCSFLTRGLLELRKSTCMYSKIS